MRLVMVVARFPKLSETFIVSKFLGLLDRGWDAHLVCSEEVAAGWAQFPELQARTDARDRVHKAWPQSPRWMAAWLLPWALLRCLLRNPRGSWRYLRELWATSGWKTLARLYGDAELVILRPDVLHFEFGAGAVDRMHLKTVLGCRVVASFRGYDLNYVGLDEPDFYAEVWAGADAVHLLGEDLWRRAQRRGCPADKFHVLISPAIDTEFFKPDADTPSKEKSDSLQPVRLLSVGRLEWKKGYEYALAAVALLEKRGVPCTYEIIGEGNYLEPILFARHQMSMDATVKLLGGLPRAEVRNRMRQADIFVHAAVSEGFCNAVLEAQCMQLPVVCSDADGLPENVVEGETGFVTRRRDPALMADKLEWLARHPGERRKMGEAGRRRVQSFFQLKDQIAAFDRLYRQVAGLQASARPSGFSLANGPLLATPPAPEP